MMENVGTNRWRIPKKYKPGMRVDGQVYADEKLLKAAAGDKALEQVANVAFLPGIQKQSMAMPDIHWGYGFPIGGVAATDIQEGVISPGGVGFDISCGIRLIKTNMMYKDIQNSVEALMYELGRSIPKGVGSHGKIKANRTDMEQILTTGIKWAINKGYGWKEDADFTEDGGTMPGADPSKVSKRACERGFEQPGTLGAGNHFIELQEVIDVFDDSVAQVFGLFKGQLVVMIHSGSRGLGHQVCTDYLKVMERAGREHGIDMPDRQLACAPIKSKAGQDYLAAMAAAVNYALTNRHCLAHWVRSSFETILNKSSEAMGMDLLYDVSHNTAKIEEHTLNGSSRKVCVHRKGATRAYPPGHPDLPEEFRDVGQPVIIPGDMGRASYILVGTPETENDAFTSTCHGAGRVMSRSKARKVKQGFEVKEDMKHKGIIVVAGSLKLLSEEASYAYKDISDVVEVCEVAGLSRKVVKVRPVGVVKG